MKTSISLNQSSCVLGFYRKSRILLCIVSALLLALSALVLASPSARAWAYGGRKISVTAPQTAPPRARLSEQVSVRVAGRGAPFITLSDGRELVTAYEGAPETVSALEQQNVQPGALASADFDEDGTPDLVSSYANTANGGGGIITLHRGNVDAIYPHSPEAKQRRASGTFTGSPFLSPARVFALAKAPDFVGAGDFDGDSHWDVVAASRGGRALYLLSGDGGGGFKAVREIGVAGAVTALVAGEINRADGLTDVVVGVEGAAGPRVLVFEGPQGALRARPEALSVPATVSSLALGQLNEENATDLAVASGNTLLVVRGRDRKLSLDEAHQAEVPPASMDQRAFTLSIKSVAVGDFSGEPESDIAVLTADGAVQVLNQVMRVGQEKREDERHQASRRVRVSQRLAEWQSEKAASGRWPGATQLVCARVSSVPADSLLVVDSANRQLHVLSGGRLERGKLTAEVTSDTKASEREVVSMNVEGGGPVAVLPMRLSVDALSDLVMLRSGHSAPVVALTGVEPAASVPSSAITNVNDDGVSPFNLSEITPAATQEVFSFNLLGPNGEVLIPNLRNGVVLNVEGYVQYSDLSFEAVTSPDVVGSVRIEADFDNHVENGAPYTTFRFTIGRGAPTDLSVGSHSITATPYTEQNATGTAGTARSLTFSVAQAQSMYVVNSAADTDDGTCNTAHCTLREAIIAANASAGLDEIRFGIGTGVQTISVTSRLPTITDAVTIDAATQPGFAGKPIIELDGSNAGSASGLVVGAGGSVVRGLVINRFSGHGITLGESGPPALKRSTGSIIEGNYIGTDINGTAALGNSGGGVNILYGYNNLIGGTIPAARNVISGNGSGVILGLVSGDSHVNSVQGNFIGTDVTGTADLGNQFSGVLAQRSFENRIGGTTTGARNIISGNISRAIALEDNSGTLVQGNLIGTDISGTTALGNGSNGVQIIFGGNHTIGGTVAAARNVISGNQASSPFSGAVSIEASLGNKVQGNFIGTKANGTEALPNAGSGVNISIGNNSGNVIGGATAEAANVISSNGGAGIRFDGLRTPLIQGNFIGTDMSVTRQLGNAGDGILISSASQGNDIKGNVIAFNQGSGVRIDSAAGIRIVENSIFSNLGLGIDLSPDGITPNDPLDSDTGSNGLQNFPVLTSFMPAISANADKDESASSALNSAVAVSGTLNSGPNATYTVHWYFTNESDCEANQFIALPLASGQVSNVTTDAQGNAQFSFPLDFPAGVESGVINCTATDSIGNTSEFSACLSVAAPVVTGALQFSAAAYSGR